MQDKLKQVISPSSSKGDEDEYFQEQEDGQLYGPGEQSISDYSLASIPMAHREYEKILRQLESECRTHIKCEQQMKLHIECLQEKLDQTNKEMAKKEKELNNEITTITEEKRKLVLKNQSTEKEITSLKTKIAQIEAVKE
jgi:predicted RNase H-like nuclease (RuvC/YqgF family)